MHRWMDCSKPVQREPRSVRSSSRTLLRRSQTTQNWSKWLRVLSVLTPTESDWATQRLTSADSLTEATTSPSMGFHGTTPTRLRTTHGHSFLARGLEAWITIAVRV